MTTQYKYKFDKYELKNIKYQNKKIDNIDYFNKLKKIYSSCIHDGATIDDYKLDIYGNKVTVTYGEMNFEGLEKIYNELKEYNFDSFIDIGSGRGKLVLYMAGLPEIKKSYGVEIVKERHLYAEEIKKQLSQYKFTNNTYFFNKSMFDINYEKLFENLNNPLIWISNLCFDKEIIGKLINKLCDEMPKGTIIACSKIVNEDKLTFIKNMTIPMSWSSTSNIHIYKI